VVAKIVHMAGVEPATTAEHVRAQISNGKFFWLDVFGGDEVVRSGLLNGLALDEAESAWALRFGQAGRMQIGRGKLRAVTWMATPSGQLIEVHVLCTQQFILSIWQGDGSELDDIRQQFGERAGVLEKSIYQGAAILLELLLSTLDHAIRDLDQGLDRLRIQIDSDSGSVDFTAAARRLRKLQSVMANFNRYTSAVRAAIVGIEAVPGMDAHGAAELDEYSEQVEDVEEQLHERRRWMSDILHDYSMAIAQRQGEQINRLTLVSLIFLPMTALTGFFGMNFNWMIEHLASERAFLVLGLLLPALSCILSVIYFRHRGLIEFKLRPPPKPLPPADLDETGWPARVRSDAAEAGDAVRDAVLTADKAN
jgi:Mg2+ and Co2+ transporter CorA